VQAARRHQAGDQTDRDRAENVDDEDPERKHAAERALVDGVIEGMTGDGAERAAYTNEDPDWHDTNLL
jgi:hypothetical protein